ncbi:uncharacterized protein EAE98_004542 [Botrytis deweyae]|uniref:Effector 5 n=2 Tax=Botrytis TaxID=33196 RepID=A0A4Z1JPU4_9HELO|nr:uncharacterized protein EAE98_004542 [Botrytis deweyae]KAF7921429.1 hypothetical protein EAE99_007737 [Botrytis elliptica]KAF7931806.1 hypothetical protein EAE98_004542 [Botrytis deweyae]TGO70897.1 hypothetical protein BELL_0649g00050 [Botrytis elliptica]
MLFSISSIVAGMSLLSLALAAPAVPGEVTLEKRGFSCNSPVAGLTAADCKHMSTIGMAGMGTNAKAANGAVWIGTQGPNTFVFKNSAAAPVTVIIWTQAAGDYQSSFMNARKPQVSYSLGAGQSVTISMANGVSGGWAGLYDQKTTLSQYGQVFNTWGEFTTGAYATVDVSREINMGGNAMTIQVGSCTSSMSKCVFTCKSGNTCGNAGTYSLINCAAGSQTGATYGLASGQPSGGCQGFNNGGKVSVTFS